MKKKIVGGKRYRISFSHKSSTRRPRPGGATAFLAAAIAPSPLLAVLAIAGRT